VLGVLGALCAAQPTYIVTDQYQTGSNCGIGPLVRRTQQIACTPGGQSGCANNQRTQCVSGVPSSFTGSIYLSTYTTNTCTGNPVETIGWSNNLCVQFGADSYSAFCQGPTLVLIYFTQTNACLGQGYYQTYGGNTCVPLVGQAFPPGYNQTGTFGFATCTGYCFHESTEIEQGKKKMTLDALLAKQHADECVVPHTMQASGVSIATSCSDTPLRLTNDHLVYSSKGLVTAVSLKEGDLLYKDMEQKQLCTVRSVTGETNQRYFGLNCRTSDVLANGIKTSTFGDQHAIPAAWMKYVTKVLSVEQASRLGDSLVSALRFFGLI